MGTSRSFGHFKPVRPNVLAGDGRGKEIRDLRKDVDAGFLALEASTDAQFLELGGSSSDVANVRGDPYYATGNGVADDSTAFLAANAAAPMYIVVPPGTYRIGADVDLAVPVVLTVGAVIVPDTGVTVTFSSFVKISGPVPVFDYSEGGSFAFEAGSIQECWVQNFGAVADGDGLGGGTDNGEPLSRAFQASADTSALCHVPAGRYHIAASSSVTVRGGSPHLRGAGDATIIDGLGYLVGGDQYVRPINLRPETEGDLALDEGYSWTQTGIIAGTKTLTLTDVSGLSVGDELYIVLGQSASDLNEPDWTMLATITGISGTDVSIDRGIPKNIRDYTGPGPGGNTTRELNYAWRVIKKFNRAVIEGLTFEYVFIAGTVLQDCVFRNLRWTATVLGMLITNIDNVLIEAPVADYVRNNASVNGAFIKGWGWRQTLVTNATVWRLACNCFTVETHSQSVCFDHVLITCDAEGLVAPTSPVLFLSTNDVGARITVRDLTLRFASETSAITWALAPASDAWLFEDVQIYGRQAADNDVAPFIFAYVSQIRGRLHWNGAEYPGNTLRAQMVIPLSAGMTENHEIPNRGLLARARVFVSNLTGITSLAHYNGSVSNNDALASITSALSPDTSGAVELPDWTSLRSDPNAGATRQFIRVVTDGTVVAGSYIILDLETRPSAPMLSGNTIELADYGPPFQVGGGAPSVNARFIGDRYFDVTNKDWYFSVQIGTGATDWVLLT